MERHNCGGNLEPKQVVITRDIGGLHFTFTVLGKQCNRCFEEIISRDTAHKLETHEVAQSQVLKGKGWVKITLNTPMIHLPSTGTMIDATKPQPAFDTSRVV